MKMSYKLRTIPPPRKTGQTIKNEGEPDMKSLRRFATLYTRSRCTMLKKIKMHFIDL